MCFPLQGTVDKLVFIDVAESATKGGSGDLDIFSLPKVEVSKGAEALSLSLSLYLSICPVSPSCATGSESVCVCVASLPPSRQTCQPRRGPRSSW